MKRWFEQLMMRYLRKRGWVVFYLEEQFRKCPDNTGCWMNLYNSTMQEELK